jgi:hypothetical protein
MCRLAVVIENVGEDIFEYEQNVSCIGRMCRSEGAGLFTDSPQRTGNDVGLAEKGLDIVRRYFDQIRFQILRGDRTLNEQYGTDEAGRRRGTIRGTKADVNPFRAPFSCCCSF